MTKAEKHLADWLRDAYAMEHQALEMLKREEGRFEGHPELRDKIALYINSVTNNAKKLEECLGKLGEDTSTLKTTFAKMVGVAQALSGVFVADEIVKYAITLYVFTHYETGNFIALADAARETGHPEIADICASMAREREKELAHWAKGYITKATKEFINRA